MANTMYTTLCQNEDLASKDFGVMYKYIQELEKVKKWITIIDKELNYYFKFVNWIRYFLRAGLNFFLGFSDF